MASIGWIGYGALAEPRTGTANCTGVLIAPDLVVTADHCVINPATGAPTTPEIVTFRAGQGLAESPAPRRGRAIRLLPQPAGSPAARIGQELALLVLDRPYAADDALPIRLSETPPVADSTVTILGYARQAPEAPERQSGCTVRISDAPLVALDCHAVSGYSGGPVLNQAADGWHLAGILVAEARHTPGIGALAIWLDPAVLLDPEPGN